MNLTFEAVQPDKAYFGEKDFQQLQIVKKLVEIENLSVEIVGCPILREANGLAMSSRNKRLSTQQFEEAVLIINTLKEVQRNLTHVAFQNYMFSARQFENHLGIEYFEIANIHLRTAQVTQRKSYRAFIAAFAGEVRLIDNIALKLKPSIELFNAVDKTKIHN